MAKFQSTKLFDGFSCVFRQWRAEDTHCKYLHGYAISFRICGGIPMAKAAPWDNTDAHARKRGEQTGLDTLVVHALNDVY